jgi:hypothetical protein
MNYNPSVKKLLFIIDKNPVSRSYGVTLILSPSIRYVNIYTVYFYAVFLIRYTRNKLYTCTMYHIIKSTSVFMKHIKFQFSIEFHCKF